eukprot:UN16869
MTKKILHAKFEKINNFLCMKWSNFACKIFF